LMEGKVWWFLVG